MEPGSPISIVDIVAESRRIDDGQLPSDPSALPSCPRDGPETSTHLDVEVPLLQVGLDDLNLGRLVQLLRSAISIVPRRANLGRKQRVDQCRLSQTRLAWTSALQVVCETLSESWVSRSDAGGESKGEKRTDDHDSHMRPPLIDNLMPLEKSAKLYGRLRKMYLIWQANC
jgi:hypothetical protein